MIDLLNEELVLVELEADSKINMLALQDEIVRSSELLNKWMKYHFWYRKTLSKAESRMNELIVKRTRYYSGEGTSEEYRERPFNEIIKNQTIMGQYIEADPDICQYREQIEFTEALRDMAVEMINTLKFRNNHIETIFNIRKFESGS